MQIQEVALIADPYPPGRSVEKSHPEHVFEFGDAHAHRGRRYIQFLSGSDKARVSGDTTENSEAQEINFIVQFI